MSRVLEPAAEDAASAGPAATDPEGARGRRREQLLDLLTFGALAVVVLLPLRGMLRTQGPPMEEGFMLVFPELVLQGKAPHRDFLHLYGPGSLWLLAAWYWVLGVTLEVERWFGFLQLLAFGAGLAVLARRWGRLAVVVAGATGLVVMIASSRLIALAWVGGVALGLLSLHAALRARELAVAGDRRRARQRAVAAGLLAGGALLFRPDLVLACAAGLGTVFVVGFDRDLRRRMVIAGVIGLTPYAALLAWAGPGNAVRGLVIEPVFELRGGRRLPIPPPADAYAGWNQGFPDLDPPPWPFNFLRGPLQLRLWFFLLVAIVAFLVLVAVWRMRERPRLPTAWVLAAVAGFSLGMIPQAIQRADSTHFGWAGAVPMAFFPIAIAEVLRGRLRWSQTARVALGGAVMLATLLFVIPWFTARMYADLVYNTFGRHRIAFEVEAGSRRFYYGRDDIASDARALLTDIPTYGRAGDRVFVGNVDLSKTPYSDAWLYYLLLPDYEPATRYIEMDPGVANADDSGLADDLASADLAILTRGFDDYHEPNATLDPGSQEPNDVLHREFCRVADYPNGMVELWVRCALLDERGNRVEPARDR
jgi:hypothetical protein